MGGFIPLLLYGADRENYLYAYACVCVCVCVCVHIDVCMYVSMEVYMY